jgi:hypothetical protein
MKSSHGNIDVESVRVTSFPLTSLQKKDCLKLVFLLYQQAILFLLIE